MINTLSVILATVKGSQPPCAILRSQVHLHNFQPSYSRCSRSSYSSQVSLVTIFTHWKTVCTLPVLESILQSENVPYTLPLREDQLFLYVAHLADEGSLKSVC